MKKLVVNQDTCISCGMCIQIDEEHFSFSPNGTSEVKSQENIDTKEVAQAIDGCPVNAISIEESDCNCSENCHCAENNDDGKCHCAENNTDGKCHCGQ